MDVIVYTLVTNAGGVDGRDHTDKGGVITLATLEKKEAEKKKNGWNTLVPTVVDLDELGKKVLKSLPPVERLAVTHVLRGNLGNL